MIPSASDLTIIVVSWCVKDLSRVEFSRLNEKLELKSTLLAARGKKKKQ